MLLHHIGIVVPDPGPLVRLFRALGLRVAPPVADPTWGAELTLVESAPVSVEIRRPMGEGPMAKVLARRGPGLHHVMFDVDGLPGLVAGLKARGVRFLGGLREHPWQAQAWIDPRQAHGGLIELGEVWDRTGPRRVRPGEPSLGHVGWAVRGLQAARAFFLTLGLPVDPIGLDTPIFAAEEASVRSVPCGISLKAPVAPGPFARYVERRGAGLHHVMFKVADIERVARNVRQAGFGLVYPEPLDEGFALTQFVRPKDAAGVLIELGQVRSP